MRKLLFVAMAAMAFATSQADDVQTVTIDGSAVNKQVSAIAFDGDNLTLTYTDGTKSESIDMSTVIITFDTSSALKEFENESRTGEILQPQRTATPRSPRTRRLPY